MTLVGFIDHKCGKEGPHGVLVQAVPDQLTFPRSSPRF